MYNGWISEYDGRPLPLSRKKSGRSGWLAVLILVLILLLAGMAGAMTNKKPVRWSNGGGAIDTLTVVKAPPVLPARPSGWQVFWWQALTLAKRI